MRVPQVLYVVYVLLNTGSSVIHAVTGNHAEAMREFRKANNRTDKSKVWMEPFKRCMSPRSSSKRLRKGEQFLARGSDVDL